MLKNKIAILAFSAVFIFIVNSYLSFLSREYVIYITDINTLTEMSNGVVCFGNTTAPGRIMLEDLLKEVAKAENKPIYFFDVDTFRINSFLTKSKLQEILIEYGINEEEIPVLMKLKNGSPDSYLNVNDYYKTIEADTKEHMKYFITQGESRSRYMPQDTVIIIIFIASFALFMCAFWLKSRIKSSDVLFALSMGGICFILLMPFCLSSLMKYIDYYGLSGNPKITLIMLFTIAINIVTLIKLNLNKKPEKGIKENL